HGHYLVARDDGRLLIGTTLEDVGFDRRNTAEAVVDMMAFATRLAPGLRTAGVRPGWGGVPPATCGGLPYLGGAAGQEELCMWCGHVRHGLWLSTGTGVVMSRLLRGEAPGVDLTPFRPDR